MHRAFVTGWSDILILYELILVDSTDPIYNPIWRQGCYGIPFISRLGVLCSLYNWSLGIEFNLKPSWTYETVFLAHLSLSGSLIVSSLWHWAYWDIEVFVGYGTTNLVLDLNQLFGIHLSLASILCNGFGFAHISGYLGPGLWTSDSLGIVGSIRFIKPFYSFLGLDPFCYGVISSNHIVAGFMGTYISLWHISSRPGPLVYKLLSMGNVLCKELCSIKKELRSLLQLRCLGYTSILFYRIVAQFLFHWCYAVVLLLSSLQPLSMHLLCGMGLYQVE